MPTFFCWWDWSWCTFVQRVIPPDWSERSAGGGSDQVDSLHHYHCWYLYFHRCSCAFGIPIVVCCKFPRAIVGWVYFDDDHGFSDTCWWLREDCTHRRSQTQSHILVAMVTASDTAAAAMMMLLLLLRQVVVVVMVVPYCYYNSHHVHGDTVLRRSVEVAMSSCPSCWWCVMSSYSYP